MPEIPTLAPIAAAPLSVVLLLTHEQPRLEELIAGWIGCLNGLHADYELLLVDDATAESGIVAATLPERFARLRTLRLPERQGEGAALRAALKETDRPLLFYTICDPFYSPADLGKLLQQIDIVHLVGGQRHGRPAPLLLRMMAAAWNGVIRIVFGFTPEPFARWLGWRHQVGRCLTEIFFGVRYRDAGCPFRLIRREVLSRVPLQSNGPFVHVEIVAKVNFLGFLLGQEFPLTEPESPEPTPLFEKSRGAEARALFRSPDFGPAFLTPVAPAEAATRPSDEQA